MLFKCMQAVTLILAELASTNCFAQLQVQIQEELIESAEDFAMELLQRRKALPQKWAAIQERDVRHLTKLDDLESGVTTTREFWAHNNQGSITLQNLKQQSHYDRGAERTEGFDVETQVYKKPGLVLYKPKPSKSWEIVPKLPFNGYPTTAPFSWCLGNYQSTKTGTMDEGYVDRFVSKRACVHSKEIKTGLVAVWGAPLPQKSPTATATVLFDKFNNLPISVEWRFYPSDWDPKSFLGLESKLIEKLAITWRVFKDEKREQKKEQAKEPEKVVIYLPVKIESVFHGVLKEEHIEMVNRIRWLINDEVPDALFADPTKNEIVEPRFPDYPNEEK